MYNRHGHSGLVAARNSILRVGCFHPSDVKSLKIVACVNTSAVFAQDVPQHSQNKLIMQLWHWLCVLFRRFFFIRLTHQINCPLI